MHDFRRKPPLIQAPVHLLEKVASWDYNLLTVEDQLDYGEADLPQMHKYACRTLARDFAVLLSLDIDDFFQVMQAQECLQESDSKEKQSALSEKALKFRLRACLQSCLQVFSREGYLVFSEQQRSRQFYWSKLKEIVLMVLRRISEGTSSSHKIIILNGWYLDVCKLLDISLIFGKTHRSAVVDILRNVLARGEELQDFHKDFRRMLDLTLLRMRELSEEFEGFAGIDFQALQRDSHLYKNFHNAESTLSRSLLKTLFSTYDLILNLQAVCQLFPARFRVQLLQQALIFKRFIMLYNKLRYYETSEWRFGSREGLFRPMISQLARAIVVFVGNAMEKVAMLVKDLPPQSSYRADLKRTYANFWYFTLLSPAVSYEFRENRTRLEKALHFGTELATAIVTLHPCGVLFHNQTVGHFIREGKSFQAITAAINLSKQTSELQKRRTALQRVQKWRLPSFTQFLKTFPQQTFIDEKSVEKHSETEPSSIFIHNPFTPIFAKQYDDEPEFLQEDQQSCYGKEFQSFELSYHSEWHCDPDPSKVYELLRQQQRVFEELDLSSIGNKSEHYIMSLALSDSVVEEDSLSSISAIFNSN